MFSMFVMLSVHESVRFNRAAIFAAKPAFKQFYALTFYCIRTTKTQRGNHLIIGAHRNRILKVAAYLDFV